MPIEYHTWTYSNRFDWPDGLGYVAAWKCHRLVSTPEERRRGVGQAVAKEGAQNATVSELSWQSRLTPYGRPNNRKAWIQLLNSAIPFALGVYLMLRSLEFGYVWTLLLALPVAGLYIRLFLIQHDCGHGSFFTSRRSNDLLGSLISVISLTPYYYWLRTHAYHHSAHGDLDRRGLGDLTTLTVDEYLALGFWQRVGYRFTRNIPILLIFGPIYQILLKHRFPWDVPMAWKREWRSVWWTNLGLGVGIWGAVEMVGWVAFLKVAAPIFCFAWGAAMWVLYVQHHFEDNYWVEHPEWSFEQAALEGSSFYDLPRILHWFTADIGYHHIHHLLPRIPNYRLRECFEAFPELQDVNRIGLRESLRCARLSLWDPDRGRMIGFDELASSRIGSPAAEPIGEQS